MPFQNSLANLIHQLQQLEQEHLTLEEAIDKVSDLMIDEVQRKALSDFIRDITHDIMMPITSIKASLYLADQLENLDHIKHHLGVIELQFEHLESLMNNLMRMNRLDMGLTNFEPQQVPINELLEKISLYLSPQFIRKNLTLDEVYPAASPVVVADKIKLTQAIMNILQNSINFTDPGGLISIRTVYDDEFVHIYIQDNGCGIAPEDLPYIFDRFFKGQSAKNAKQSASGLGLTIAKKIIDYMRGSIVIDSQPGEGTLVKLSLRYVTFI